MRISVVLGAVLLFANACAPDSPVLPPPDADDAVAELSDAGDAKADVAGGTDAVPKDVQAELPGTDAILIADEFIAPDAPIGVDVSGPPDITPPPDASVPPDVADIATTPDVPVVPDVAPDVPPLDIQQPDVQASPDVTACGTCYAGIQDHYVKASNSDTGDNFGTSVAISGTTLVVGAPGEGSKSSGVMGNQADNSAPNAGAVYVFTQSGGTWGQQAYLKSSWTSAGALFGKAVAISDDTLAAGSPGLGTGGVQVFVRSGTSWSPQSVTGTIGTNDDKAFGAAVALSGDTLVVGAPMSGKASLVQSQSGAAYVLVRSGGKWTQQAALADSNVWQNNQFGQSVAVDGDTAVVGSSIIGTSSRALVYTRTAGVWTMQQSISPQTGGGSGSGAKSVGISGDTLAVFAGGTKGGVFIYTRSGGVWSGQATLNSDVASSGFGASMQLLGDTVLVGAPVDNATAGGSAFLFQRTGTTWSQKLTLVASNPDWQDYFGSSVAFGAGVIAVGAQYESSFAKGIDGDQTSNENQGSGAVYLFH